MQCAPWETVEPIDALPPLGELLGDLASAACATPEQGGGPGAGALLRVSVLAVDLPIEIGLRTLAGTLCIEAAPPTQIVETTVMPVWHRLRLRVTLDDGERHIDGMEA